MDAIPIRCLTENPKRKGQIPSPSIFLLLMLWLFGMVQGSSREKDILVVKFLMFSTPSFSMKWQAIYVLRGRVRQLELRYFTKVDHINLPSWISNTVFQSQEC